MRDGGVIVEPEHILDPSSNSWSWFAIVIKVGDLCISAVWQSKHRRSDVVEVCALGPRQARSQQSGEVELIDIALVPLLCFDLIGHRVGYGGGYYDKFLAACRPDCKKVGLSVFDPVESISDIEPHDVRLDFAITPDRLWKFN